MSEAPEDAPLQGLDLDNVTIADLEHIFEERDEVTEQKEEAVKSKGPRRLTKMQAGLWGEANIKFGEGHNEQAAQLCKEVIRQAPTFGEPYQTLALIYDTLGDSDLSFKYSLLGAKLSNSHLDEDWFYLAAESKARNLETLYLECLNRAQRCTRDKPSKLRALFELFASCEAKGKLGFLTLSYFTSMLESNITWEDAKPRLETLEKTYLSENRQDLLCRLLLAAYTTFPAQLDVVTTGFIFELLFENKLDRQLLFFASKTGYIEEPSAGSSLDFFQQAVELELEPKPEIITVAECKLEKCVKVRSIALCSASSVRLGWRESARHLRNVIIVALHQLVIVAEEWVALAERTDEVVDLDEAEEMCCVLAVNLNMSVPALKLYGRILRYRNKLIEALAAFRQVLALQSDEFATRTAIAEILTQLEDEEGAQAVLEDNYFKTDDLTAETFEIRLKQCLQLTGGFVEAAEHLLFGPGVKNAKATDILKVVTYKYYERKRGLSDLLAYLGVSIESIPLVQLRLHQRLHTTVWELYIRLITTLSDTKRYKHLLQVTALAFALLPFVSMSWISVLHSYTLLAAVFNNRYEISFSLLRSAIMRDNENPNYWNLMASLLQHAGDQRFNRYILRSLVRHPDHIPLTTLNAHCAFAFASFRHAIAEYGTLIAVQPSEPQHHFCLALQYLHLSSAKYVLNRTRVFMQGIASLQKYIELRGENQETLYNTGRFFMQVAMYHSAEMYFKRALRAPPLYDGFDLTPDIAYNLAQIYNLSGSRHLSVALYQQYIVID